MFEKVIFVQIHLFLNNVGAHLDQLNVYLFKMISQITPIAHIKRTNVAFYQAATNISESNLWLIILNG